MCDGDCEKVYEVFANQNPDNIWTLMDGIVADNAQRMIAFDQMGNGKPYYDSYRFFNEAGRNLIFSNRKVSNVRNYEVKSDILAGLQYVIGTGRTDCENEYRLPISRLFLKFYQTGTAILIIQCSNAQYRSIDDVKRINEYGRRLGLPYWPEEGTQCEKCASYLRIVGGDGSLVLAEENFLSNFETRPDGISDRASRLQERNPPTTPDVSLAYVSTIVRMLLDRNGSGYRFRGKPVSEKKQIQMKLLLDDKMYVAAFVCDGEFCRSLYRDFECGNRKFSPDMKRQLLELLRVDLPGKCSVSNEEEQDELIASHLYMTSFSEKEPKLMCVTDQSYIKLVPTHDYEEGYYDSAYVPLIVIPIVQRNSIALFQQKIMDMSAGVQSRFRASDINLIMDLQQYVGFQNRFLQKTLTPQKEGRFLYEKLQAELDVEAENIVLDMQISKLFELANISQGYAFNKWALVLSLAAMITSCFAYILTAQDLSEISLRNFRGGWIIVATIIIVLLSVLFVLLVIFRERRK